MHKPVRDDQVSHPVITRAQAMAKAVGCALFVTFKFVNSIPRSKGAMFAIASLLVIPLSVLFSVLNTNVEPVNASSDTLNFQGRLLTDTGGLVADGTYNVEFNLYNVASGGSTLWTEDRLNTNTQGVTVRNGYFSVYLGEYDTLSGVNWSQDLWLGMTIRGTGSCAWGACTPADSEMTPRFALSAVPYAYRAANVASATVDSADSDDVNITTGDTTTSGTSGDVNIDTGAGITANGSVSIGATNASALLIGRPGATLTVSGDASSTIVLNGVTISASELSVLDNGIEAGDLVTQGVANDEYCLTYETGGGALFEWQACGGGGGGIDTVGALDGGTANANGATISSNIIYLQSATGTYPGLVNTVGQTFAGAKTFEDDIIAESNVLGSNSATATTGNTESTSRTNVTSVTLDADSFDVNDVVYFDNSGQDYFTRIVVDNTDGTYTVSPAVSYDADITVTLYNVQNIGVTATDYTALSNRFFQGYFLGGISVGTGTTSLSDGNLQSSSDLFLQSGGGAVNVGNGQSNARLTVRGTSTSFELSSSTLNSYSYTGAAQTFTVPAGITSITAEVYGAQGQSNGNSGGQGGYIRVTIPVTPGETLQINVGGQAGWNGGGTGGTSGGGGTDIRRGSYTLSDRLVVAGGGGGASNEYSASNFGGYPDGGSHGASNHGSGGTQSAGGAGGLWSANGTAGALGQGGNGANDGFFTAGGGGGGLYGGGGGGDSGSNEGTGGGGSSGYDSTAGVSLSGYANGTRSGDGFVAISYVNPSSNTNETAIFQNGNGTQVLGIGAEGSLSVGSDDQQARLGIQSLGVSASGTITSSGTTVTGVSTEFMSELNVGDVIEVNNERHRIVAIASDTSLTLADAFSPDIGVASTFRVERPLIKTTSANGDTLLLQDALGNISVNSYVSGSLVQGFYLQGGAQTLGDSSTAGTLSVSDGSSNYATIDVEALAGDYTVSIPTITGNDEFCLVNLGNCAGSGGTDEIITVATSDTPAAQQTAADYLADGTADDVEINAALASLSANGGVVHLLPGTYEITDTITIDDYQTLEGEGDATTLFSVAGAASFNLIENEDQAGGNSNVTVRNIRIDGNNTGVTGTRNAIDFENVGSGSGASAVRGATIDNVTAEDDEDVSFLFNTSYNSSIINSVSIDPDFAGIGIVGSARVRIENNQISGAETRNISIENSTEIILDGNTVDSAGQDGVYINNNVTQTVISNNVVSNNGSQGIEIQGTGVQQYNTIDSNSIFGNTDEGIRFTNNHYHNLISGNAVYDNDSAGTSENIALLGAGADNQLIGNRIRDVDDGSAAIYIAATVNTTYLADNVMTGTTGLDNNNSTTVFANQLSLDTDDAASDLILQAPDHILLNSDTDIDGYLSVNGGATITNSFSHADLYLSAANATSDSRIYFGEDGESHLISIQADVDANTISLQTNGGTGYAILNSSSTLTIGAGGQDGELQLYDGSSNYTTIQVDAQSGDYAISIPTITGNDTFCLESLANCGGGGLSATLADNTADAWDIQEGTNNYINIDTTDSSEAISFGNATTNPQYNFLGGGNIYLNGNVVYTAGTDCNAGCLTGTSLHGDYNLDLYSHDGGGINLRSDAGVVVLNNNNSTTAFQIQNAASDSLFNVDSTDAGTITLFGDTSGELAGSWTATTSLNEATAAGSYVTTNGYIYDIGGYNGSQTSGVHYAKINSNGTIGSWIATTSLPIATSGTGAVAYGGYMYVTSGYSDGDDVYYAKINSDGTLGAWITQTNIMPEAVYSHGTVAANGYLYVLGGLGGSTTDTVGYAKINADGSLGTFSTTTSLPGYGGHNPWEAASYAVANGYIYMAGGGTDGNSTRAHVSYAKLNADGTIGSWTDSSNDLAGGSMEGRMLVNNGYLYYIGGHNGGASGANTHDEVYYSKLNSDGTNDAWVTASTNIPSARRYHGAVVSNGNIYVLGGFADASTLLGDVYLARASNTLQVGGNLDLVGLQGGNLAEGGDVSTGSAGGSITAGNGMFVGSLQVQGQSSFNQSLSVNDMLNVAGELKVDGRGAFGNNGSIGTTSTIPGSAGTVDAELSVEANLTSFEDGGISAGVAGILNVNPPSNPSSNNITTGLFGMATVDASNSTDVDNLEIAGIHGAAIAQGSGDIGNVYGLDAVAFNISTGTVSNLTGSNSTVINLGVATTVDGSYAEITNAGSITEAFGGSFIINNTAGTIGTAIGLDVQVNNSNTINDAIGISVTDAEATNATNLFLGNGSLQSGNYSIYNSSTRANYFAGTLTVEPSITTGDSDTAGQLRVSDGSSNYATIDVEALAGDYTVSIPTITGNDTFCLESLANCGGSGVSDLQGAYNGGNTINTTNNRDILFTLEDTTTDSNFVVNIASVSGSYFALQNNGTDAVRYDTTNGFSVRSTTYSSTEVIGYGASAGGINSVLFGAGSSTTNDDAVAIGHSADSDGSGVAIGYDATSAGNSVVIGRQAGTSSDQTVAIGSFAGATSQGATSIGWSSSAAGYYGVALGVNTSAGHGGSIAIGGGAATTAADQLVVNLSDGFTGSSSAYFGNGVTNASPNNFTLNATGGSGTNVGGADFTLAAGRGTGSGAGGAIYLQTAPLGSSGTSLNSLVTRLTVQEDGDVQINSGRLSVSDGSSNYATIDVEALAGDYTISIPTVTGNDTFCLESLANCAGGGVATLQGAYDGDVDGGDVIVELTSTDGGIIVRDNTTTPLGSTLFAVQNTSSADLFSVAASGVTLGVSTTIAADQSLILTGGVTLPVSPTEGEVFYDSGNNVLYMYDGSGWDILNGGVGTSIFVAASDSPNKELANFVADGTDDQVEINAAIASLPAAGGVINLMEGTFVISDSIELANNTNLRGTGTGTILQSVADGGVPNDFALVTNEDTIGGNNNLYISDVVIDGNKGNITASNRESIYFENVGSGTGSSTVVGFVIDSVTIIDSDRHAIQAETSDNSYVANSRIIDSNQEGIHINGSSRNTFADNYLGGNTGYGISLTASNDNRVSGNIMESNGHGVRINNASNYNVIDSNSVRDNSNYGITMSGGGTNSLNVFSNNSINGNGGSGIRIETSFRTSVIGNSLYDNDSSGASANIYIGSNADDTLVSNNFIRDVGDGSDAIEISASNSDRTYLADNVMLSTAGISDSGTDTIYANQLDNSGNLTLQANGIIDILSDTDITGTLTVSSTSDFVGQVTVGDGSTAGTLRVSDGSSNYATIDVEALAGDYTVSIPTITGNDTFCLESLANCGGGGGATDLQDAYDGGNTILADNAGGDIDLTVSEATNFIVDITGTGNFYVQDSGVNRIQVENDGDNYFSTNTLTNSNRFFNSSEEVARINGNGLLTVNLGSNVNGGLLVQGNLDTDLFRVNATAESIGIGLNPDVTAKFEIDKVANNAANSVVARIGGNLRYVGVDGEVQSGLQVSPSINPASDSTATYYGISASPTGTNGRLTGADARIIGVNSRAVFNHTSVLGQAVGGRFYVENETTGTITEGRGLQVINGVNPSGTITDLVGINIAEQTSGSDDNINLLIGQTIIPDGDYSIYNASTLANFFGGTLTVEPSITTGDSDTAGQLRISDGSSNYATIDVEALAGDYTVSIPTITGNDTFCLETLDNCGGSGTDDELVTVAASDSSAAHQAAADYLADGTDDQVQINDALTAAAGGRVLLLPGTYTTHRTDDGNATVLIPNDTILEGSGPGTVVQLGDIDATDNLIENSDTSTGEGIVIRNLTLDGQNDLNTSGIQYGIYLNGVGIADNSRKSGSVERVNIIDFRTRGVYLNNSYHTTIIDNKIENSGQGIRLTNSDYSTVNNNTLSNNGGATIYIESDYVNVTSNSIYNSGSTAIWMNTITYSNVSNNIINTSFYGVNIDGGSNNIVSKNTSTNSSSVGINLDSTMSNIISSNVIHSASGADNNHGISIQSGSDYNQIVANYITDDSCNTTCYAIRILDSASDKNTLENNRYSDTDVDSGDDASIFDDGTNTIYINQQTNTISSEAYDVTDLVTRVSANSTTAFQIQNAAGASALIIDTTNLEVELGGDLVFENAEVISNAVDGELRVTGDLNPSANDTYSLGSDSLRWADLYLGPNSLNIGTSGDNGVLSYNTTDDQFEFNQNLQVQGYGAYGNAAVIGGSPAGYDSILSVEQNVTSISNGGSDVGIFSALTVNPNINPSSTAEVGAVVGQITIDPTNTTNTTDLFYTGGTFGVIAQGTGTTEFAMGSQSGVINVSAGITNVLGAYNTALNAQGTVSWLAGTQIVANNSAIGVTTEAVGADISVIQDSIGALTTARGIEVLVAQTSGTISNAAGVQVHETEGTNATNLLLGTGTIPSGTYSIYNASSRANYFAGALTVDGAIDVNSTLQVDLTGTATTNGICHSGADIDTTGTDRELVACSAAPNDYAEFYPAEQGVAAGDIVSTTDNLLTYEAQGADPETGIVYSLGQKQISIVKKAQSSNDTIIGIVSTAPYQTIGKDIPVSANRKPIALNGRVPVNVNNEGGPINAGDRIALSSIAGVGKRATSPGMTVGIALEPFTGSSGQIMIYVQNYYYVPSIGGVLQGNDLSIAGDALIGGSTEIGGSLNVSGQTTVTNLTVTGTVTVTNLTVTGDIEIVDLTVNGKIITQGDKPEVLAETTEVGANTASVTVNVEGTDVAGRVELETNEDTPEELTVKITFNESYEGGIPIAVISPVGKKSNDLGIYIISITGDEMIIGFTNQPADNKEYNFNYQIIQTINE